MNSPLSQSIIKRFFEVLEMLIDEGVYSNVNTYSQKYGLDRSAVNKYRKDHTVFRPQPDWFAPIIINDGLNAVGLYSGIGKPFSKIRGIKIAKFWFQKVQNSKTQQTNYQ